MSWNGRDLATMPRRASDYRAARKGKFDTCFVAYV